jgi:hypothetical protein
VRDALKTFHKDRRHHLAEPAQDVLKTNGAKRNQPGNGEEENRIQLLERIVSHAYYALHETLHKVQNF